MEVGKDAARFFYVMRKSEQHLDFDIQLAKSSPMIIRSIIYNMLMQEFVVYLINEKKKYTFTKIKNLSDLSVLAEPQEIRLLSFSQIS